MAFKTKTKNRQIIDDRQTLDAKHNNILQSFTENKNSIEDLQNELNNINLIIDKLNIENAKSPILNLSLQQKIWECDDRKKLLEETINRIENNIDETDYMLKTGKLLSNYYKIINEETNIASNDISDNIFSIKNNRSTNYYDSNNNTLYDEHQSIKSQNDESISLISLPISTPIPMSIPISIPMPMPIPMPIPIPIPMPDDSNNKKKNIIDWFNQNKTNIITNDIISNDKKIIKKE